MSTAETKALIEQVARNLGEEVPALRQLRLVIRLELRARGDVPTWRVELPGPKVTKDAAGDARVEVSIPRPNFNELAKDGRLRHWADAYEHGQVSVAGDTAVVKLVGSVMARQLARGHA